MSKIMKCRKFAAPKFCIFTVQSTSLITTTGGASEKCPYSRSVVIPEVSLLCYSWMGLCSGHEISVVIRELSLHPQSLLAKLTVHVMTMNDMHLPSYTYLYAALHPPYKRGTSYAPEKGACLAKWLEHWLCKHEAVGLIPSLKIISTPRIPI